MMNYLSEEKNLPEKLSEDIIEFILQRNLKPGDRLPNESVLAQEMGAGRSTVREAMKLLASRNIVTVRQGSGTYVSEQPGIVRDPLGFTFIRDKKKLAADLLEVRFLLEPSIASMAAARATEDAAAHILALCDETEALLLAGQPHAEKDVAFHTAVAMSSGNLVVPRLVPIINSSIPLFIDLTQGSLKEETIASHRAVARAIAAHDPVAAHDAMYLHLVYNRSHLTAAR